MATPYKRLDKNQAAVLLVDHHTGDYQPRVKRNVPTKNYIVKARKAKDELDDREALASARQALEMLSEKVWHWLASHDLGLINLQLPGVGAEPSLRGLCDALNKKLKGAATFNHASKAAADRLRPDPRYTFSQFGVDLPEQGNA